MFIRSSKIKNTIINFFLFPLGQYGSPSRKPLLVSLVKTGIIKILAAKNITTNYFTLATMLHQLDEIGTVMAQMSQNVLLICFSKKLYR